jgi:hypothetical protein
MHELLNLIKRFIWTYIFDLDFDSDPALELNQTEKSVENPTTKNLTFFNLKKIILIIGVVGISGILFFYLNANVSELAELQKLLDQLMLIINFDLF